MINWLLRVKFVVVVSVETAASAPQASEQYSESGEEQAKEKPRKASTLTVPGKEPKQKSVKSSKRHRKVSKAKEGGKEEEKDDDDEGEETEEEEEEEEEGEVLEGKDRKETKRPKEKETKGFGFKRRDLVVGECREEKAPYVKVREARMVTLADKVSSDKTFHSHLNSKNLTSS